MGTNNKAARSVIVFLAGFLPWALLWPSIGAIQAFLVGVVVAVAAGFVLKRPGKQTER
jgi:multisubunit Na+/H+ antiporter MnhE subunit